MTVPLLPIDGVLPELVNALASASAAVVLAAPGAGKSTRVPLALNAAPWASGRVVMLEPRRLAARAVAARMAQTLGEDVGATVGYRVRLESRVSSHTRIEVVTEGVFTGRIQSDPALDGVSVVVFDEFHERSIDADLGLALCLDVQRVLRPDLKIVVMSATLDDRAVANLLSNGPPVPVIACDHRPYPVVTRYLPRSAARIEDDVGTAIRRALSDGEGSVLAFLPGEAEIRRTQDGLSGVPKDVIVAPLFAALSLEEQNRAIAPAPPGRRKVVLATTIAETSLTIEGVRIVVDGGLKRVPRFDPARGMTRLTTVRVSAAAAEQRRGRAARLGPGVCYRLWSEPEDRALPPFDSPEIAHADLASLALDLAGWGVSDPTTLSWMTPPPPGAFAQARDLLARLGAIDAAGLITAEGKAMAALPLHPRLAHMVHRGRALGQGSLACDLAALLSERDLLVGRRDPDITARLRLLARGGAEAHRAALARVRASAKQIRAIADVPMSETAPESAGALLALAYPDRIAQRRGGDGRYRLSGGGGAILDPGEPLAAAAFLVAPELDGAARDARIFLAAQITREEIEDLFADDIVPVDEIAWDPRENGVVARRQRRFGALVLDEKPLADPDPARVAAALFEGIRQLGLSVLPWTPESLALRQRVTFLRRHDPDQPWPDMTDDALAAGLEQWLGAAVEGMRRREHLARLDLLGALRGLLPWSLQSRLDELAPTHLTVPSGSRVAVNYGGEGGPSLEVKLQEMFGQVEPVTVVRGRVPVTLHLLSPAQRPLAVTRDLASFWANAYPQVRGEMRTRYPRHIWPEDPRSAVAVRRTIQPRKG
jgi:ATP-dependent helicase HrpB